MDVSAYRSGWWDGDEGYGIAGGSEAIMRRQRGNAYTDSYMVGYRDGKNRRPQRY
jgi:hypothetical protein